MHLFILHAVITMPNSKDTTKRSTKKSKAVRTPKYAPVTLSEQDGVRFLHFGTEWIQGAMRIRAPNKIELAYAQQMMIWMLFNDSPTHIVQLGLGAATLTKFCYHHFLQSRVTAIELNPAVISICYTMFRLPQDDERLNIIEMNAHDFVNDPAHRHTIDILQIDLYDATAQGPVLDTPEFYLACAKCLTPKGMITVNLFGEHPSYAKNIKAMQSAFSHVMYLPKVHDGNVVVLACNHVEAFDFNTLATRGAEIQKRTKLPTKSWVNGLKMYAKIPSV